MENQKVKALYNWEKYILSKMKTPTTFSEAVKAEDECMISVAEARQAALIALQEGRSEIIEATMNEDVEEN